MDENRVSAPPRWIIHRWKRYGHDRLYAKTPGGTELGYFDLQSGHFHADDPADLRLLEKAVADHLGEDPQPQFVAPSRPRQADDLSIATASWTDLSATAPGQAAQQQAERAMETFRTQHRILAFFGLRGGRSWRVGAAGEQAVAAQLAGLGPEWRVLHAVRVGTKGSDIDHVATARLASSP